MLFPIKNYNKQEPHPDECVKTKPDVVACGSIFEQPTTGNQDYRVGGGEGV
jgi:hypothetical protein